MDNSVPQQGYPTLPNSYGIGAQIDSTGGGGSGLAPTPQTQAGTQYQNQSSQAPNGIPGNGYMNGSVTQPPNQYGSNGFNPWSLSGEANAR